MVVREIPYRSAVSEIFRRVRLALVSAVTPTDRWLSVWCIWRTKVETLLEFQSRHRIGWIIQDFRETCVFNVPPGNKDAVMPRSSWKKKAIVFTTVTTSAYQDQLNAGFSKVCEIFKVCGISFFKWFRVLHTGLLLWWHFHAQKHDAERINRDWLFDMYNII